MAKYLRQLKTGRVYIWSPYLAKRKDMVEYDPTLADMRIQKARERLEALKAEADEITVAMDPKITADSQELATIEAEIDKLEEEKAIKAAGGNSEDVKPKTQEEIDAEEKQKVINEDPEIKKIEAMDEVSQVKEYIALEFGIESKKTTLENIKKEAIERRVDRLFES